MNETKQIEFNLQEANVLIQLIDLAIKAEGLKVAEAGIVLTKKIQDAFNIKPEVNEKADNKKSKE